MRDLPRCATFTPRAPSATMMMRSVEVSLMEVVLVLMVFCGVGTVPVLQEYDIWGDGVNFVNGSEGLLVGGQRSAKGEA